MKKYALIVLYVAALSLLIAAALHYSRNHSGVCPICSHSDKMMVNN